MKPLPRPQSLLAMLTFTAISILLLGCGESLEVLVNPNAPQKKVEEFKNSDDYYDKFFNEIKHRASIKEGTSEILALDVMPKDPSGNVNWTAAVVGGYIDPRGAIYEEEAADEPPFNLNIFMEAKVPLMSNVIFPHSVHTYWLSCNNCHPKIFIPEAGANPITMDEIFQGQWCGRCHGKVAFTFWPRDNCVRCHAILKGQSLEKERWR
ncbi:MAG: hypothetical protein A2V21_304050 [Deltaproteobacteria bacterium GWC2_55_46]|nr:MAG: hypothetical protein A2V21_304050 [Deltaproteobacteria bacterium GWC2_55_46]